MFRLLLPYLILACCLNRAYSQPNADSLSLLSISKEDSSLVKISRMNINSPQSDFSPFVLGRNLFFVSGRNNKVGIQYADADNSTEITDLYEARLSGPEKARNAEPLEGINTKYYEGPFSINRRADTVYFTGNDKRTNTLKIYVSARDDNRWSPGQVLPICSDSFSYCHPSLSASGRELYFSSNRTQDGNMDIFVSKRVDGTWTPPVNAGTVINSPANEVFPFAGSEGQLYFSSNRPGGLGGLDLYIVNLTDSIPSARLLFAPLNSSADDFGIWTDSSGAEGYFSTNRVRGKNDDIYRFSRSIPDFTHAETPPVRKKFCYTFYEENSLRTLDTANMAFEWRFGDGQAARGLTTRHCYTTTGVYNVELLVVEKVSGEVSSNLLNYEVNIPAQEQLSIDSPDTANVGKPVIFNSSKSAVKGCVIKDTWWNFGDGFYNSGPIVQHRFRKEGKYIVQLWIMASDNSTGATKKVKFQKEIVVGNLN